ncbi:MAG: hypothetical protein IKV94_03525 [Clostridia bacterium]|nr:hypothetical protein [Clostridia bacterium]
MVNLIVLNDIDVIFNRAGFNRFMTAEGFFYLEASTDLAVFFNTSNKTVLVYDYETMEAKQFNSKILDLIDFVIIMLGWRNE